MRQKRSWHSRQHEYDKEHRLFRTTYDPNRTSRMRRCGPTPALTMFVAYPPTSSYEEEEVEAFYMDLEKFFREDHAFFKVIIGDSNAKVGPRRTPEELHTGTHGLQWNDQGGEALRAHHDDQDYPWELAIPEALLSTVESPGGGYRNEIDHIKSIKGFA
ncbi:hypothetical protein RB195_004968 [Necator americanus]|uniref:Endonuclease/exonuclease/phosphatase domain-containing protein n=1 Tax=Necator americanus TaxID=51031 RepID=A0ABR1BM50_NECAM